MGKIKAAIMLTFLLWFLRVEGIDGGGRGLLGNHRAFPKNKLLTNICFSVQFDSKWLI